ncbi:MAG: hypothetical protein FWC10_05600 [Lentimicrobiaceae bacterium]|nr:hypothetical protein [Lentimicrobiaceae bacterium]
MRKICLFFFIIILLASCTREELDRTIFIPDEDDRNLPAYTEWGYNTFGAEYERDYFLASDKIVPCKILFKDNQLQFSLSGTIRDHKEMTLSFIFSSPQMEDFKDLLQLHNKEIDLTANDCIVKILRDGNETILHVFEGKLHFKRVQLLSIEDQVNRVILSGIFDLTFMQNDFPAFIYKGRFDLGITTKLFYVY